MLADDRVTAPAELANAPKGSKTRKLWESMSATNKDWSKSSDRGEFANNTTTKLKEGVTGYEISTRGFNPYAKQVFAALNYGRRVNDSSVFYGYRFFVFKSSVKEKAIYFAGDTFRCGFAASDPTKQQATYNKLDLAFGYSDAMPLCKEIWDSCYPGQTL